MERIRLQSLSSPEPDRTLHSFTFSGAGYQCELQHHELQHWLGALGNHQGLNCSGIPSSAALSACLLESPPNLPLVHLMGSLRGD